jgi:hypothetical protein
MLSIKQIFVSFKDLLSMQNEKAAFSGFMKLFACN